MEAVPTDPADPLRIPAGRAHLAVARAGLGRSPAAVFLHAGIADHRSWSDVMELLGSDIEVVAYDRRGFGTTTYEPEGHDQVADLCAVLDALGLERVVLVGNSRGGEIALDATLTHPARVRALVLVSPSVSGAPAVTRSQIDPAAAAIWETLEAADAAGALDALNLGEIRLWLDGPTAPEGRIAAPRRVLALEMNRIALHAESPGHEPEAPDAWSRLSEITVPVLVVVGDLDLRHVQERGREVAGRISGATLRVIPGAAHLPAFEQPEAFADIVRAFLRANLD